MSIVQAQVLLNGIYSNFPMGTEIVSATLINDINLGTYYQLDASQKKYSFDYYAIYSPLIVLNSNSGYYITAYGFTASFDPRTQIYTNTTSSIYSNSGLLKAVYR